ncbi:hypothetical protein IRZ59_21900 [Pseudomonas guariconensis]|uniref:hypothetical protein n=1 Tax=Pseudomonas guariconensis TaxID=1288410 RepID=UPI0018A90F68|nr:hypothetical protein [Pseudomonas guariconensis]MBF8733087.1 hypothetical protein [Pseudomonas guariconensis]
MDQRTAVLELVDALQEATEKARSVLELLRASGTSLEGFSITHRSVMGSLWALEDYIEQIEGRLSTFNVLPAANDD